MTRHIYHISTGKYLCKKEEEIYCSPDIGEAMSFNTKGDIKEQLSQTPGGKLEHMIVYT